VRFADGVAEEITNTLEHTDGLHVLARRSSFAFRDRPLDVRRIAELLGVDYIVDGSYRESADSAWISAQLIDGSSGFALWSKTFATRPSSGRLYSIQNGIAGRVAAELSLRFREGTDPADAAPDGDTFYAYLEGLYALRLFQSKTTQDPDPIRGAIESFRSVTAEAPGWAPGWAALGEAHHWAAYVGIEPRSHRLASKRALEEALTLDPDHAQANASYGYVLHRLDHDSEGAEIFLRRAVELDSEQYWHCGYPLFLLWVGRYDEAVHTTRMAHAGDPMSWALQTLLAMAFRCAEQPEDAVHHAERALAKKPQAPFALRELVLGLERSGRPAEALATLDMAEAPNPYLDLVRALVLARNGHEGDAEALLRRTDTRRAEEWTLQFWPARTMTAPPLHAAILVALGHPDDAIAELEAAAMRDTDTLLYDRCYPELRSLESDPRYRQLLARIGVREQFLHHVRG
jgi:TolB-like protein/tetratricopeptide (TPR) repeat protein